MTADEKTMLARIRSERLVTPRTRPDQEICLSLMERGFIRTQSGTNHTFVVDPESIPTPAGVKAV
jgi:hypothetical protein